MNGVPSQPQSIFYLSFLLINLVFIFRDFNQGFRFRLLCGELQDLVQGEEPLAHVHAVRRL